MSVQGMLLIGARPCRALVVDDNSINRKMLDIMLREAGAVVEQAEDGQIACDIFANRYFDVVFMDIQMPEMDGYLATRVIRGLETERCMPRTPIIMVSAHIEPRDIDEAMAAGADLHLAKPVNVVSLLAATRDALDGWQVRPRGWQAFCYA